MTDITFNDKKYIVEDLPERAQYIVSQINDIQNELAMEKSKIDRLEVANNGFKQLLAQELEKEEGA
jgi:hypothetical protein